MFDNLTKSNMFAKLRDKIILSKKDMEDTLVGNKKMKT